VARVVEESVVIAASPEEVFDLLHDYDLRLQWDPFLRQARLENGAMEAGLGVSTYCAARLRSGGLGMHTTYVSFHRPGVAAVKMTAGPWFLREFAASIVQKEISPRQTRVGYKFSFSTRPRWAAPVVEALFRILFRYETKKRLKRLKAYLESARVAPIQVPPKSPSSQPRTAASTPNL